MSFKSINEIEQFSFEDCVISKLEVFDSEISMELESLIVKPNNSQNTNFTESYSDTTRMKLVNAKIISALQDGYKYYDANEVLLDEVPDKALTEDQLKTLPALFRDAYLFAMDNQTSDNGTFRYILSIELPSEDVYDNTNPTTYSVLVSFERSEFTWDRYLNRVQR